MCLGNHQGNPDIVIGMVDIEIDENHPDLAGKIVFEMDMTIGAEDSTLAGGCNHGTAITGQAIAQPDNGIFIAGSGYNTSAAGYIIEAPSCSGNPWRGFWQAGYIDNRPIINVSWNSIGHRDTVIMNGNPIYPTRRELVRLVVESGTLFVFSAGNWDHNAALTYVPEGVEYNDMPGVLIVSGIGQGGKHGTTHTRRYSAVDLCAPARTLASIRPGSTGQFSDIGGLSNSAPFAAGVAALCLDVNPCLTPPELEALLKGTTDEITDEEGSDFEGLVGTGYINAHKAVLAAQKVTSSMTITDTELWDYPRNFNGTLTIADGGELTITSSVAFSEFSRIVVEPGGRLIVDGGRLKRGCDNDKYWDGIEVMGDPNSNQFVTSNQGFVKLNNASVEYAKIGVSLFDRHTYTKGGGILYADDTKFINCQTGVSFAKYTNYLPGGNTPFNNISHIRNSEFTIDKEFPFEQGGRHIHLDRITGLGISGCTLTDEREEAPEEQKLQTGLWASNATFLLTDSHISNMLYGVKSENIRSDRTFSVSKNIFTNNFYGISVRAVDAFAISQNEFEIGGFRGGLSSFQYPERHTGIFVDRSSGFFLMENNFKGSGSARETVGITVNDSNIDKAKGLTADHNEIFGNTFEKLFKANVANGDNRGDDPVFGGLVYLCNQNQRTLCTDFTVFDGSIASNQIALGGNATGNTFSHDNSCNTYSDFDNLHGNPLTYHYYDGSTGDIEEPLYFEPFLLNTDIAVRNECSNDENPGPEVPTSEIPVLIGEYPIKKDVYTGLLQQYHSLIDGGDSESLMNLLSGMAEKDKAVVLSELNNISPYLSEEILKLVTEHTLLTKAEKMQLLSANPEGLKGAELEYGIINGGYFDAGEQSVLTAALHQSTDRSTLESDLRQAYGEMQNICHSVQHYYMMDKDEIGLDYDAQFEWAANHLSFNGALQKIDLLLKKGDVINAQIALSDLLNMDLDQEEYEEALHYYKLKEVEIDLLTSNREYEEINTDESDLIESIAVLSNGRAGIQAENWISLLKKDVVAFQNEPQWGTVAALQRSENRVAEVEESKAIEKQYLKVQPNPSSDNFTFFYHSNDEISENGTLNIFSSTGKLLFQKDIGLSSPYIKWQPASHINDGLFIYHLIDDKGLILQKGKLVFIH